MNNDVPSARGGDETSSVSLRVERWKRRLIDQTRHNQLINYTPRKRATVEVVDEVPQMVLRQLVQGEEFGFDPRPDDGQKGPSKKDTTGDRERLDRGKRLEKLKGTPLPERHTDNRLQTHHTESTLEQNLLHIHRETEAKLEEEGINSLFLALGMLKWFEDPRSDTESTAPLIMVPVELTRPDARSEFSITWPDEEILLNPAIVMRCKNDFNLEFPELPEISQEVDTHELFEKIRGVISDFERWKLTADIALGLFDFKKYLMWRDLDEFEEAFKSHDVIRAICKEEDTEALGVPEEVAEAELNDEMAPWRTVQPLDADSSQQRAMLAVRKGYNLVIEGPPGTGKSQTITNLIADQLNEGKRVLFVSEKAAALDVVETRLESVGLGEFSLELHSHKASKPEFTRQLRGALDFDRDAPETKSKKLEKLQRRTEQLQQYVDAVHEPVEPAGWSVFEVVGEIAQLRELETVHCEFRNIHEVSGEEFDAAVTAVDDLHAAVEEVGRPSEHPLRGFRLTDAPPGRRREIASHVQKASAAAETVQSSCEDLAEMLEVSASWNRQHIEELGNLAQKLAESPGVHESFFNKGRVDTDFQTLRKVVQLGREYETCDERVQSEKEKGLLVFLIKFLILIPALFRRWRVRREIEGIDEDEKAAVSPVWEGVETDWNDLRNSGEWLEQFDDLRGNISLSPTSSAVELAAPNSESDRQKLKASVEELEEGLRKLQGALGELAKAGKVNLERAGLAFFEGVRDLEHLRARLEKIQNHLDELRDFAAFHAALKRARSTPAGPFVDQALAKELAPESYVSAFRRAFLEQWVEAISERRPILREFHGDQHRRRISEFQDLDEKSKEVARKTAVEFLLEQRKEVGAESLSDQLQLVRKEAQKKSKIMPLRKILERAPDVVQLLQPCFLMSPLSVAKYTNPDEIQFDLVIFDEASQIPPADAVGPIVRGHQIVVVGDSKQLPPTNFFGGQVEDFSELQEKGREELEDLESILDEAKVSGLPSLRLKWHYRSEDESLIRFSNEEFYNDDPLYTFPSADRENPEKGLRFEYLPDAVYTGGGENEAEAKRVADAVVRHIKSKPNLSLGVGTFGMSQQTRIRDELERRRREDSSIEWFFNQTGEEKFFVKNLENIQGDDRDVIFISVTYGPNEDGRVHRRFGPINQEGGWRRLNVLTTRAKKQVRVFSSMRAEDISLKNISEGARLLRKYLKYAETGEYPSANISHGGTESPFERAVKREIESLGYEVESQVGEAGFRIDLGVIDPEVPGRYLCGVECDGASYHSAATVRDRDRIRQKVLEDRGWTIHRIWSTDWFYDPEKEIERLDEVLEQEQQKSPEPSAKENLSEDGDTEGAVARTSDDSPRSAESDSSQKVRGEKKKEPTKEPDSKFERQVAACVEDLGWKVEYQVNVGGYRVDIGVRDRGNSDRLICGIECDGATYHRGDEKRTADTLRQSRIEDGGLPIYRVWSTDWREERTKIVAQLHEALEDEQEHSSPAK